MSAGRMGQCLRQWLPLLSWLLLLSSPPNSHELPSKILKKPRNSLLTTQLDSVEG
jgi:hypothetical protein